MVEEALIERAAAGDVDALVELDAQGLIVGGCERTADYAERLRCLKRNLARLDSELSERGQFSVQGVTVAADRRIPAEILAEAGDSTESLYRFRIDWVPGFFINPRFSLLFGGCAFYFYPDFFVLFIIRRAFARRRRWLIYGRRELLAHESCHVARIGLDSLLFEELFAYQTAPSAFRRFAGSVFRRPADSFAFLGSTLLLLGAQALRTLALPWLPIWPFWGIVGFAGLFLIIRHLRLHRRFLRAQAHAEWLAPGAALALLFRCTDREILDLAELEGPRAVADWFEGQCERSARWQVIKQRCCQACEGPAVSAEEV